MKFVLLPPFVIILASLAVSLWVAWRTRRRLAWVVVALDLAVIALSLPAVARGLLELLVGPSPPPLADARTTGAGAIVVLSAGARRDVDPRRDMVDEDTLMRTAGGAGLYHQTGLPLLVTGAVTFEGRRSIAELMRDALVSDFDVPAAAIWVEPRAETTRENAVYSVAMLRAHGVAKVLLVTEFTHMRRAAAAFRHEGMAVVEAPIGIAGETREPFLPSLRALTLSYTAAYEGVGRWWYQLRGWE